jgi:hypothetical protein
MFGTWAALAINANLDPTGIAPHTDAHDFREGLCWTIPFGDFEDGDLNFPKLNLKVKYKAGDVAAFQSLQQHEIKPFTGTRFSLVLFSHNTIFTTLWEMFSGVRIRFVHDSYTKCTNCVRIAYELCTSCIQVPQVSCWTPWQVQTLHFRLVSAVHMTFCHVSPCRLLVGWFD